MNNVSKDSFQVNFGEVDKLLLLRVLFFRMGLRYNIIFFLI